MPCGGAVAAVVSDIGIACRPWGTRSRIPAEVLVEHFLASAGDSDRFQGTGIPSPPCAGCTSPWHAAF